MAKNKVGAGSPLSVTGLTAGKSYHCRVLATNAVGSGPYSAFGPPWCGHSAGAAADGDRFDAGLGVGLGGLHPGFKVAARSPVHRAVPVHRRWGLRNKVGPGSPLLVTGLTGGKSYHCRVLATNAVGSSPYGAFGATVVVGATAPPGATVTNTVPLAASARVFFTSNGNGGSPITGYLAQCVSLNGGVNHVTGGSASPIVVTGLTPGKQYHCHVRVTNAVGSGGYGPFGATVTLP